MSKKAPHSAPLTPPPRFARPGWHTQKTRLISFSKCGAMMTQAYEAEHFDPPAVALCGYVTIKSAVSDIHHVPMLIDHRAQMSRCSRRITVPNRSSPPTPDNTNWKHSTAQMSTAPAITAELLFLGQTFRGQFLLIDSWHGILGRNVLNNLSLLLDGPSLKCDGTVDGQFDAPAAAGRLGASGGWRIALQGIS